MKSTEYHNLGGTIRTRTAQETLSVIRPYIEKAGITRIANLTYLDHLALPVYTCFRPASKNLSTSQGKGLTDELAQCSAYMEGIEHYYSESITPDIEYVIPKADDPAFITSKRLPRGLFSAPTVAKQIHQWSQGQGLIHHIPYYVPTYFINLGLDISRPEDGLLGKTTTGLASGNTKLEASCHALYEVIERYEMAQFRKMNQAQQMSRLIDLTTVEYADAKALITHLQRQTIDLVVFDLTHRFKVPTYHCIIAEQNPFRNLGNYSGAGTHYHKGIALCRAITEAIQSRLTYIAGSRDDMYPRDYKATWQPLKLAGTRDDRHRATVVLSLEAQYQQLLAQFERLRKEVILFEHTQKTDAISVVHVVVPGCNL